MAVRVARTGVLVGTCQVFHQLPSSVSVTTWSVNILRPTFWQSNMTMENASKCHISRGISHEDLHSEGIFQPATFDFPKALSYGTWTRFHLSALACCCKYLAAAALSRSSPAGGQASRNWRRPTSARTFLGDGCPQKLNGYNKGWGQKA